jgi:IclR family mhp operon transcriptional activator
MLAINEGRGTVRVLRILRALNIENGASVSRLSIITGTPRPALYRILAALVSEGYVVRRPEDGRFLLTSLVRSLSEGFRDEQWIGEVALSDLEDLQKKVVWPTEMATCHNFSMHLISSTRRLSPFVIDYGHVGVRLPVLRSALGLAYLAHCSPAERDALLEFLRNQPPGFDGDLARKRDKVARALAITRRRGYAIRQGSLILGANYSDLLSKNATLAVPVLVGGRAVAAIAVTYIAAALSASDAVEKYLNTLMNAAAAITLKLEAQL